MEERFRNLDYQNWKPVRTLGTDSYGTVYEIARDDGFGMVDHAALKVLSIPASPEDFDALVAEGRTPEEVAAGFPARPVAKPGHEAALKKRTLTNLYNERPAWLDMLHRALDQAVAAAYGWEWPLTDDEILRRLFELNQARSAGTS